MADLEFRKFLTTYGVSNKEYESLPEEQKQELINKYNQEHKAAITQGKADTLKNVGAGMQGCGCSMMLIPILAILLIIIFIIITM